MLAATPEVRSLYETDRGSGSIYPLCPGCRPRRKLKRDLTYEESVEALRQIVEQTCSGTGRRLPDCTESERRGCRPRDSGFHRAVTGRNDCTNPTPYRGAARPCRTLRRQGRSVQLAPAIAIILAEIGLPVVLHGDEGVPTKEGIGPGPVMGKLGIAVDLEPDAVQLMVEAVGSATFPPPASPRNGMPYRCCAASSAFEPCSTAWRNSTRIRLTLLPGQRILPRKLHRTIARRPDRHRT